MLINRVPGDPPPARPDPRRHYVEPSRPWAAFDYRPWRRPAPRDARR